MRTVRFHPQARSAALFFSASLLLASVPVAAINRRAFVTSVTGTGNLSSWAGATGATVLDKADSICRARAAAATLPNATTYRAWLSTSTTDAYCHVQGLSGKKSTGCGGAVQPGAGPWYLANGITPFSGSLAELTGPDKVIFRPVLFDENGDEPDYAAGNYWTGTDANGVADSGTCLNWTSADGIDSGMRGHSQSSAYGWTGSSWFDCNNTLRLLCFETGASAPFHLGWSPAALAFVSSATGQGDLSAWPQAGGATGIAAGDAICRNLAAAAHLPAPESFVAWLSDGGHDARDRVTLDANFRRVDAYPIANSHADLIDGFASNSLHVDEHGSYAGIPYGTQTGTYGDGTKTADRCFGWTTNSAAFFATFGEQSLARSERWTEGFANDCSNLRRIYCFGGVVVLFWDGFESSGTGRWSAAVP